MNDVRLSLFSFSRECLPESLDLVYSTQFSNSLVKHIERGLFVLFFRTFAPKSSHAQIFLNLPPRKVMIYFCQKGKKIGCHRLRFGENMPRKIP